MNIEDIKVGEKYKLELLCILNEKKVIVFETPTGDHIPLRCSDIECVSPANGIKNTEHAPKYDPCRWFRKGDKVQLVEWRGRAPFDCENWETEKAGQMCIVAEDEDAERGHYLHVWKIEDMATEDDERPWLAFPIFSLELVTPVEELGPYMVKELKDSFIVYHDCSKIVLNDTSLLAKFMKASHPNAKSAAEAECARLNAEYRKGMEK